MAHGIVSNTGVVANSAIGYESNYVAWKHLVI